MFTEHLEKPPEMHYSRAKESVVCFALCVKIVDVELHIWYKSHRQGSLQGDGEYPGVFQVRSSLSALIPN